MNKWQQNVQEFQRNVVKQPTSPAKPELRNPELRAVLILEEAFETVVALVGNKHAYRMISDAWKKHLDRADFESKPNLVEAIDGLCDLVYVCIGASQDIGIDLDPFFEEVHRSNMAKAGAKFSAYGKICKPEGWQKPDIAGILKKITDEYTK